MAQAATYSQLVALKQRLKTIDAFLDEYSWLINSYTTDYFTLDFEKKLPSAFHNFLLKECTLTDLATLLPDWSSSPEDADTPEPLTPKVLPLSLLTFKTLCHNLALNQSCNVTADTLVFGTSLGKYFRVCMKAKKQHEVDNLADMLSYLCKNNGCEHVVDIGAGQGHLSRLLSYDKHLKVTTIEATDFHSPKAQRLDQRTQTLMIKQKVMDGETTPVPNHISTYIKSDITTEEFISLLKQTEESSPTAEQMISHISTRMSDMVADQSQPATSTGTSDSSELPRFDLPWVQGSCVDASLCLTNRNRLTSYSAQSMHQSVSLTRSHRSLHSKANNDDSVCLSGLHTCGDLASTMIRVFVNLPCARILSSVGCCYMKLTTSSAVHSGSNGQPAGFPLSEYVKSLTHHSNVCTYQSLEMGCHSLSQYRQRLLDGDPSLKRHVIRSALQTLLLRRKEKSQIQFKRLKIKNSEKIPFKEYAQRAFLKLGLVFDVTADEISKCEEIIETHWRAVVGAYTIRLALAPLIEAYILLDRMVYLWEHDISSRLLPLFDPMKSPRNMVLVAVKDTEEVKEM